MARTESSGVAAKGWTLIVKARGNGACRSQLTSDNNKGAEPRLNNYKESANFLVAALVHGIVAGRREMYPDELGAGAVGYRMDRQGGTHAGKRKYIRWDCRWNPTTGTHEGVANHRSQSVCYDWKESFPGFSAVGGWNGGDHDACGGTCMPFGTNGNYGSNYNVAAGLYDSANCFDAWGFGNSGDSLIWLLA